MGTRFVVAKESSAHQKFKEALTKSNASSTELCMKSLVPVRLFKNKFYQQIKDLEANCSPKEELLKCLGKGRARLGMLDGDLDEGELEIGQVCALLQSVQTTEEIVQGLLSEFKTAKEKLLDSL
jgi:enoyl-[acyl-carrier protein] reductase II